jgi:hypothetical protein
MQPGGGNASNDAPTANRFKINVWNARQPMALTLPLK